MKRKKNQNNNSYIITLCTVLYVVMMLLALMHNNNENELTPVQLDVDAIVPESDVNLVHPDTSLMPDKIYTLDEEEHTVIITSPEAIEETLEAIGEKPKKKAKRTKRTKTQNYYGDGWSSDERYLLAKMVMAEAEGETRTTKEYIVGCILNRVLSDTFPNSVEEVIYQPQQFSPIIDGRWQQVEPNKECYEAVDKVLESKSSVGSDCLYFESCNGSSWHSRNLTFLFQSDNMRFYK